MNRRFISILIIASVLLSVFTVPSIAAESRASEYFSSCKAELIAGEASGEIIFSFRVSASVVGVTRIGVLSLFVYRANGTIYKVVTGNTSNGFLKTSGTTISGTYTISAEPNTSYYCSVTFIVENASGNDTRGYTTNTVTAPA